MGDGRDIKKVNWYTVFSYSNDFTISTYQLLLKTQEYQHIEI
jgi:hypothetical protein